MVAKDGNLFGYERVSRSFQPLTNFFLQIWEVINKNKWLSSLTGLLLGASFTCFLLFFARLKFSDSFRYAGLLWNLFLAWVPFCLSVRLYFRGDKIKPFGPEVFLLMFLWFIFFPNAPYILTDFQHLYTSRADFPVWYDVILLIWFALTGLFLGIVSLFLVQEVIRKKLGMGLSWVFVVFVSGSSAVGVFLGRFVRLNSWDLFHHPKGVLLQLWSLTSELNLASLGFLLTYSGIFLFVYLMIYGMGRILPGHQKLN